MKKLIILVFGVLCLTVGFGPARAQETVCTQYYGGGVVCGVRTPHTPIETGIADSLPLIASGFLGASGVFAYFSKRLKNSI